MRAVRVQGVARLVALAIVATAAAARADEPPRPRLGAVRATVRPHLDGKLDDPAWRTAPLTRAFTQKFPQGGAAATERTTVRVVYDDEALWIGVECDQTAPLIRRLTRRDRPVEADQISVTIDSRGEGTSAMEFTVNAAGVLSDLLRFNDTDTSEDWDENWDARVATTPRGWSAELRVPLRILRFPRATAQSWGLQVRRYVSWKQETDEWAFIPRTAAGEVSRYGRLDGLVGLRPGSPLELRPFVLGRVRHRDPQPDLLGSGWDAGGSIGLDLKWHLTQALTLDATINPDFGQVEADQVVLNLTNYEVFFPEKRPFFLEGIDIFTTPLQLLYTRRIGRTPPPAPVVRSDAPWGEELVDLPTPSPIAAAAKLVGAIGPRLTVGALAALTTRNAVLARGLDGADAHRIADPMTLYTVLRVRTPLRNGHLGLLATTTTRFEPAGLYPLVPSGGTRGELCPDGTLLPADARCFHDAYVVGPDARWRSADGAWAAYGQAVLTATVGGPPRQLLDGTVLKDGDLGGAGVVGVAKEGGDHWVGLAEYRVFSPRADFNDLGYMQRQAVHRVAAELEYRTLVPWRRTLETHTRVEVRDDESWAGLNLRRWWQLNTYGRFRNFWSYFVELHWREQHFDDREVGDGTALERAGLGGLELGVSTDPRKRVFADLFATTQVLTNGFNFEFDGRLVFRLLPQLDLDLLPTASVTFGEPRYAGVGPSGELLFGRLSASSVGATLRATWTFTPRLTLQLYTQLFLAQKHYGEMLAYQGQVGPGRLVHLSDLKPTTAQPLSNPDLEESVLNVNLVLRWEYRLGSTLYFVYTRSQAPTSTLGLGQPATLDIGSIRRGPASDVLLLKLTWFWA